MFPQQSAERLGGTLVESCFTGNKETKRTRDLYAFAFEFQPRLIQPNSAAATMSHAEFARNPSNATALMTTKILVDMVEIGAELEC